MFSSHLEPPKLFFPILSYLDQKFTNIYQLNKNKMEEKMQLIE